MSEQNGREIIHTTKRTGVLLPLVFHAVFDYRVPAHMSVQVGDYVRVPFGRKQVWGVVWGAAEGGIDEKKIKDIECVAAHLPPMSKHMRDFIDWVAWYTLAPRGMVLKMALSAPDALEPPVAEVKYQLVKQVNREPGDQGQTHEHLNTRTIKLTPSRTRIIAYLSDGTPRSLKEITVYAKVTANVVREFIKAGGLEKATGKRQEALGKREALLPRASSLVPSLSAAQSTAAAAMRSKFAKGFSVTVIDGVTGSGKTEVYFDAIAKCIEDGKQALVLLPEIALSVQWLARFEKRFGFMPDVWHSHVSAAKKRGSWRGAADGSVRVLVGARSALFVPFASLSLIIVDEEHDTSYKQEDGVIYHARDMAVARAAREKIPAVLVSATPSLETEYNIESAKYARVHLPSRHGDAELPSIHLIDMRKEALNSTTWISQPLKDALLSTIAQKQQAMLFMNRRGYAPLMLCRSCGHRFQCPQCTSWLVLHRSRAQLACHHCGHVVAVPKACPECKKEDSLIPYGPGVERVAEEARLLLPDARIEVMTSDQIDTPAKADALVNAMMKGEIDVLIGTQMIAKGHHFAGLAMVGVIDGDMGLAGGDLRASEHTYQLLHQLAGRAGREKIKGEVWLQTYLPEHPVMQALAAGDRDRFMLLESQMREDAAMPPYGKLAAVIIEGKNEKEVAAVARELVRSGARQEAIANRHEIPAIMPHASGLMPHPLILGPAPAPLLLLRGKYRYRILIKAPRTFALQQWLADWLLDRKTPASVRLKIDVDPYSFV